MNKLDVLSSKIPKELLIIHKFIVINMNDNNLLVGLTDINKLNVIIEIVENYYNVKKENISYKIIKESKLKSYWDGDYYPEKNQDKSIVDMYDEILTKAIKLGATDIHIEPYEDFLRVRLRIMGQLQNMGTIAKEKKNEFIARLKIMGQIDVAEKRRPQDGRIKYDLEGDYIDVRISTLPLLSDEKVVLRILDKANFGFRLEDLELDDFKEKKLLSLLSKNNGLILVVGPSGSGKTTSLYTVINHLKSEHNNILTIEDPIEYTFKGINQSQINSEIGYTFEKGLYSILRQDPDIILIGELRDEKTSNLAVRAAETGHLVLSSLHTNNSASAIFRLLGMNIDKHLLISSLKGIISQRLIRILCDKCKRKYMVDKDDLLKLKLDSNKEYIFYEPVGCPSCIDGYIGRKPILEIVSVDRGLRKLLEEDPYIDEIEDYLYVNKMSSLLDSAVDMLIQGKTSLEEVYKL